jgi:hypothetical protein
MISNQQPLSQQDFGLSYVEVEVTGPNRDLHSGYMVALWQIQLIFWQNDCSLHDENNHITIPGFTTM